MSERDPLRRFSSRVQDYVRYRPSYPAGIAALLEHECGLNQNSTVADVGSGTGLSAKLFLDFGCRVLGIEPNAEMRSAGEAFLAEYPKFSSVEGRAEQTGLPDSTIDMVVASQAFHWFDANAARREFQRILRPPAWVVLIWNKRQVPEHGFLRGYEELLQRYAPDYSKVDHRQIDGGRITDFFGHRDWRLEKFDNRQEFDLAGARGRLDSSSYAPRPSDASYLRMIEELEQMFAIHQVGGRVNFIYQTEVYFGKL